MQDMNGSTPERRRRVQPVLLAAAVLFTPAAATDAVAQSDAGTVNATLTVQANAITVTGIQDLDFGVHFAGEGIIPNQLPAVWNIEVSNDPTIVDLSFTVLPSELIDGAGLDGVPLFYGPDSFGAQCLDVLLPADPISGIQNCEISPGSGFATLGDETLGLTPVQVDLSSSTPADVYSATIELTATIN